MAIQTESWKQSSNVYLPIQTKSYVPKHLNAPECNIFIDYNYAMQAPPEVVFPTYDDEDSYNTIPLPPMHAVADMLTWHDENDVYDENLDPHWQLPDEEKFNDDEVISSASFLPRSSPLINRKGQEN